MRARSLAREGQLSARRPNGVRGNANPLPSNSGVVATDDPVRRREDEEGGVSDNPQIDGMNPDRTGGDRATVGGVGGTGGDTQNRGTGQATGVAEGSVVGGGGMESVFSKEQVARLNQNQLLHILSAEVASMTRDDLTKVNDSSVKKEVSVTVTEPIIRADKAGIVGNMNNSMLSAKDNAVADAKKRMENGSSDASDKLIAGYETSKLALQQKIQNGTPSEIKIAKEALKKLEKDYTKAISNDVTKRLTGDPNFLSTMDPKLKANLDSANTRYGEAVSQYKAYAEGYGDLVAKGMKPEDAQKLLKDQYDTLIKPAKDALDKANKSMQSFETSLQTVLSSGALSSGSFSPDSLSKLNPGLVDSHKIQVTKPVTFSEYRDSNGNTFFLPSSSAGESIKLIRAMQESQFMDQARDLNKSGPVKIDLQTGQITHGLDGKPLTTAPGDFDRRKEALDAIKAQIPNFDPATNPAHAKMEALGNFRQAELDGKLQNYFETEVNGIKITTMNDKSDLNFDAARNSNGSSWMDIARTAKEVGANEVSVNSIIKPGSHANGYALDIGSIKADVGGKPKLIEFRFHKGDPNTFDSFDSLPQAGQDFLNKLRDLPSTTFYANPWEVRMGGATYENLFHKVDSDLWNQGNIDKLKPDQVKQVFRQISEASENPKLDPNNANDRNIMTQMWNHRHHLHVSEVEGVSHAH